MAEGRPAEIRGIVAETVSAIENAARTWCRKNFEEDARRNRCQEVLSVFARNPQSPHIEEETKRDIVCISVIEDARSPMDFDRCRKLWGDPTTTDPTLVAQRERQLRAVYDAGDIAYGMKLGKDLDEHIFMGVPPPREEVPLELSPLINRPEAGKPLQETIARESAVLGGESAAPAPTIRLRRPGAPPMGRPPSLIASTARRGSAAQALADSVLSQQLTAVNECLKKCEAVAGFADALTATLREAMR